MENATLVLNNGQKKYEKDSMCLLHNSPNSLSYSVRIMETSKPQFDAQIFNMGILSFVYVHYELPHGSDEVGKWP